MLQRAAISMDLVDDWAAGHADELQVPEGLRPGVGVATAHADDFGVTGPGEEGLEVLGPDAAQGERGSDEDGDVGGSHAAHS